MFVARDIRPANFPTGVGALALRQRREAAPAAVRARLRRKQTRDLAKAALAVVVVAAVLAAVVGLRWIVWGGYFNH